MERKETPVRPSRTRAWRLVALLALPAISCAAGAPTGPGPRGDAGARSDAPAQPDASVDAGPKLSANALACQRLKGGPFTPIAGKFMPTYADPAPTMSQGQAYRVTLPAPPKNGSVGFMVPAKGDYVIFTSRPTPIQVFDWSGVAFSAKDITSSVSECTEVKTREVYDLPTDTKPYVLRVGGDSADPVDIVVTPAMP